MQVLCIENSKNPDPRGSTIIKGDIYNSIKTSPIGQTLRSIDMWHNLKEHKLHNEVSHVTIFVQLPSEEGQSFKKEETVEIPQKLQPYYS